jgi:hypothetical protein
MFNAAMKPLSAGIIVQMQNELIVSYGAGDAPTFFSAS